MKRKLLSAALIGAMLVTSVPAFAANKTPAEPLCHSQMLPTAPGTMTPLSTRTTKGS